MTGRQAWHRVVALSRRDQDREHKTCASSFVCISPLAVCTFMGFLDVRRVSSSQELKTFLLSMCIDAPESITKSRSSGFFRKGCRHYPCFGRRVEGRLVLFFELVDTFRQVSCFSAGASFLLRGFLECPVLQFSRARIKILRFTLLHYSLRWTLSVPNFYVVLSALGEFHRCDLIQFSNFL